MGFRAPFPPLTVPVAKVGRLSDTNNGSTTQQTQADADAAGSIVAMGLSFSAAARAADVGFTQAKSEVFIRWLDDDGIVFELYKVTLLLWGEDGSFSQASAPMPWVEIPGGLQLTNPGPTSELRLTTRNQWQTTEPHAIELDAAFFYMLED